ncbi:MAG TPA: DUF4231 domain-containing protein [Blastocatellia bacterium]|nr:DUF4231 domain-containing protein [Blastocatellia bacterium]
MIILFKRWPFLFWKPKENEPIVSPEMQQQFPALQTDFAFLEQQILEDFRTFNNQALHAQNQFRQQQIWLIIGGVVTTTLGALQAAWSNVPWPGVAESIVAAMLTTLGFLVQRLDAQKKYYSNRLKAELLRGEYFLFLGRIGAYNNDNSRQQTLIRRVVEIQSEKGA